MKLFFNYFFHNLEKKLRIGFVKTSGRNFSGKVCVHHKGGGNKRSIYFVDFFRRINSYGFILKVVKTSLFNSFLGLVVYQNGLTNYIILSENVKKNSKIFSGSFYNKSDFSFGYSLPVSYIPLFSPVNNIEFYPFSGGLLARSAGTSAVVTSKTNDKVSLKLKSGWNLSISNNCICSVGLASNSTFKFYNFGKAGKMRALGIRPTVRGVAMNPCDHPHGGGEGKKSPSVGARSPWGWLTKGTPSKIKKHQILKKNKFKNIR